MVLFVIWYENAEGGNYKASLTQSLKMNFLYENHLQRERAHWTAFQAHTPARIQEKQQGYIMQCNTSKVHVHKHPTVAPLFMLALVSEQC